MFKYYNPNLISGYKSYSVEQICKLYAEKKLHPQTIREWVKSGGLEAVSKKPILIYGEVLKAFLQARNNRHKKTLRFDQFKCVKCKEIDTPQNKEIILYQNKSGSFRAVGLCAACGYQNTRFYKKGDEENLQRIFIFKKPHVMTICDGSDTGTKTNLKRHSECLSNEPQKHRKETKQDVAFKTNMSHEQLSLLDLGEST